VVAEISLHVLVPQRLSAALTAGGELAISFQDADGGTLSSADIGTFLLQTSTNLVDWMPLNVPLSTNGTGGLVFQAPISSNPSTGFFRVVSQ
jgi:hypothetical protein